MKTKQMTQEAIDAAKLAAMFRSGLVPRCGLYHSGNHTIVQLVHGYGQCQGCAHIFSADELLNAEPGQIGSGGAIR